MTLAWQIAFLIVASDPLRYRPIMIAAIVEKFGYVAALVLLAINHRVEGLPLAFFGGIDLAWGIVFLICYLRLSRHPGARSPENR